MDHCLQGMIKWIVGKAYHHAVLFRGPTGPSSRGGCSGVFQANATTHPRFLTFCAPFLNFVHTVYGLNILAPDDPQVLWFCCIFVPCFPAVPFRFAGPRSESAAGDMLEAVTAVEIPFHGPSEFASRFAHRLLCIVLHVRCFVSLGRLPAPFIFFSSCAYPQISSFLPNSMSASFCGVWEHTCPLFGPKSPPRYLGAMHRQPDPPLPPRGTADVGV